MNDRGAGRPDSAPAIDGDELLNLLVDVARLGPDAIFLIDPATGVVLWVNVRIRDLAGWEPADVIGRPIQSFDATIPGDPLVWSQITSEMPIGQLMTFTGAFRCHDGSERPVDVRLTLARHGDVTTLIAVAREVEGRVRVEERLREREATLATVIGALHDGVLVVDREGMVTLANPRAAELTGIPLDQIVHEPVTRVLQSRTDEQGRAIPVERSPLLETLSTGRHLTGRVHGVRGAEPRWLLVNTAPIVDEVSGEIRGAVATNADITELIRAQEQLEDLAGLDPLTGLPNRARFQTRLAETVERAQGSDLVGLLFLDLDGFKTVNDTLGHSQGDELLRLAGTRLRSQLRPEDFVARIGGDEFVVVLPALPHDLAHADATEVAQRIVDNLSGPFELTSQTVRISASIGIAFASAESADAEQLLRQADLAMYAAKEGGRGAFRIYEPEMDEAARHALELDGELRRALAHGELAVKLQPRIDVATGALSGAEVLLRWPGSSTGPFDTAAIVAAGERNGLIQPIGRFVLGEACRVASHLLDAGLLGEGCTVSVNVSGFQLQRPEFVSELAELLAKYHLPFGAITVELTESALVHGFVHASTRLHELGEIGVPMAIDDFGTGYSSLAYLRDLPVRELKLDQSFVADLGTDRVAETIVQGIIGIAQRLGIDTVAEGVERPEQLAFLAAAGCTHYQGYLASAALTIEDFLARYAPGAVLR